MRAQLLGHAEAQRCAGVLTEPRYDAEPGVLVERYGLGHTFTGLEHKPLRAERACFVFERGQQRTADPATAERWRHVHPLDLGIGVVEAADRSAADYLALDRRDEERTYSWCDIAPFEPEEVRALLRVSLPYLCVQRGDECPDGRRPDAALLHADVRHAHSIGWRPPRMTSS